MWRQHPGAGLEHSTRWCSISGLIKDGCKQPVISILFHQARSSICFTSSISRASGHGHGSRISLHSGANDVRRDGVMEVIVSRFNHTRSHRVQAGILQGGVPTGNKIRLELLHTGVYNLRLRQ